MNCKNVEPLLSLYVGGDLEAEHARLVAAHLQSCTECSLVADEYVRASQLLQGYEAPLFSDEVYTGIREQVLHEIERESDAPGIFSHLFLALVQPRMRWITATLLLAISVTALYLSRKPSRQQPNDRQVAVQTVEPNQAGSGPDVRSEKSTEAEASISVSNKRHIRVATVPRPISRRRDANAGVIASNLSRELLERAVSQPSSTRGPLRVEIQTSDRNIRIIWLSGQRRPAGGSDGLKGI